MTQTPTFTPAEAHTQATFTALMWALSYPGRLQTLPISGLSSIGETLLDLETTFFTPDQSLAAELARTTARQVTANQADYLFFPTLTAADLNTIAQAKTGTMLYPDQSATLIIGCQLGSGMTLQLTGPGIQTTNTMQIDGVPVDLFADLFNVRQSAITYPLGWDLFFVDGVQLIGLPRTTNVNINSEEVL